MKGTEKIRALILASLLACCLLFTANTGQAAFWAKLPFNKESNFLAKDSNSFQLFNILSKHASYRFTIEKNRKRFMPEETALQIGTVSRQPGVTVVQKTAFTNSFYSLSYFYHFTSRGPPLQ